MPQQNRDAIEDTVLKIRRHIEAMPNEDRGPTPEEKDTIVGCVLVVASLAINLDRIADAAERIAQALEDEDKIDAPQIENLIDQEPGICPVCEREGVTMFCGKPLCPKAPF